MKIEIEQDGSLAILLREQPGTADRDGGGTDSSTAADERRYLPKSCVSRFRASRPPVEDSRESIAAWRHNEIIGCAGRKEVTIEADIVDRTEGYYSEIGPAGRARSPDLGDRRRQIGDVEQHDTWRQTTAHAS